MIEKFEVFISTLERERRITVFLPENYRDSSKSYPVLYMHDGQNLFEDRDASFGFSWGIKDYLEQSGQELIVVGIDCNHTGYNRFNEYGPWINRSLAQDLFGQDEDLGGEGDAYISFIVHELKQLIDSKYRTLPDETSMAGSSMGGLISTYAACKYSHIFRKIASLSSAYWFNQKEIEALIKDSDLSAIEKFYMDVGTKEITASFHHQDYIDSSDAVYDILKEKVSDYRYEVIEDAEHNEAAWRKRVPEIFKYLYS
ncbi:alpha/beta hydrolase [Metabacillus dongyingensis]|uniref:alpha/beta hydrolase n=1 Tax=Metabacillus dongyingensis TaxID=2874282 RepID=UPI001CBF24DF|nr:alpha/beta hydrolase-fold protein [Metabacillus dongyingensis]UAL52966.1 alpha/beta hydrolase [Metabacillus dongyingensis]